MNIDIRNTLTEAIELMKTKRYLEAEQKFRTLISLCHQIEGYPSHPASVYEMEASVYEHLGNSLYGQKRLGEAYLMYTRALETYKKKLPNSDAGQARCLQGIGDVSQFIGDDDSANKYYREAEERYQRAGNDIGAKFCRERYSVEITRDANWFNMIREVLEKEIRHNDANIRKQAEYLLKRVVA